jgi:glycosyltransferase involved in cell wall biosynthesis
MRIVAVLAIRNGVGYVANALGHLVENGVRFHVIDNGSTDGTLDVVLSARFRDHLEGVGRLPYRDEFALAEQLFVKMQIIERLDADWVIHLDVDEIMHSYREGETLRDAIARVDAGGHNVIDFNEFVFLPVDADYDPTAGVQPMRRYYFFQPGAPRLMRAWKRSAGLSMLSGAGHVLGGGAIRLAPETFALRHYMFTDQAHAFRKYADRRFSEAELAHGWHANRARQPVERFRFPDAGGLCGLDDPAGRGLDRSRPRLRHYWQW